MLIQNNKKTDGIITVTGKCLATPSATQFGEYSLQVPSSVYNIPYYLAFKYASPLLSTSRIFQIGGIPLNSNNIGPTFLYQSSTSFQVSFQAHYLHGLIPLDFTVEIRSGYNNFTGDFIAATNQTALEGGAYSLLATATGYKSDLIELIIDKDMTIYFVMIADKVEDNEIRILLS